MLENFFNEHRQRHNIDGGGIWHKSPLANKKMQQNNFQYFIILYLINTYDSLPHYFFSISQKRIHIINMSKRICRNGFTFFNIKNCILPNFYFTIAMAIPSCSFLP